MCGIAGIISSGERFTPRQFNDATSTLHHRGPDAMGTARYELPHGRVLWLGHTRLAIHDLSTEGQQPMERTHSSIVFNGEVYNFQELRKPLQAQWAFRSRTDTEVLLAGLFQHGNDFIEQINGMFALAFYDKRLQTLTLSRDRVGKKPLYVYRHADVLAFASELKFFSALGLPLHVDEQALAMYRWLSFIPGDKTIYRECSKMPAASIASLDLHQHELNMDMRNFWDPFHTAKDRYQGSYQDALSEFSSILDDAVQSRLQADVPVGAFLSGGIDSSLVVASLARLRGDALTTYTVKAADAAMDESAIAQRTAQDLGVPIEVLPLATSDYQKQIDKVAWHYDEPFADSSQIPTMAIAQAAKQHVSVVLTGDGGDELFLGYRRLAWPQRAMRLRRFLDAAKRLRTLGASFTRSHAGQAVLALGLRMSGRSTAHMNIKTAIAADFLQSDDLSSLHDYFLATCPRELLSAEDQRQLGDRTLLHWAQDFYPHYDWQALRERSMTELLAGLDFVMYMRDDILVKVDRATMAYGLEARSPLLDYRMVEFAMSLPLEFKMHQGQSKRLLRDSLRQQLGDTLATLPKRGFSIPLPENLPKAHSPAAGWNRFIEDKWRTGHLHKGTTKSAIRSHT